MSVSDELEKLSKMKETGSFSDEKYQVPGRSGSGGSLESRRSRVSLFADAFCLLHLVGCDLLVYGGTDGEGDGDGEGGGEPPQCQFTNDGECDEPTVCPPGTDTNDCSLSVGTPTPTAALLRSAASKKTTSSMPAMESELVFLPMAFCIRSSSVRPQCAKPIQMVRNGTSAQVLPTPSCPFRSTVSRSPRHQPFRTGSTSTRLSSPILSFAPPTPSRSLFSTKTFPTTILGEASAWEVLATPQSVSGRCAASTSQGRAPARQAASLPWSSRSSRAQTSSTGPDRARGPYSMYLRRV